MGPGTSLRTYSDGHDRLSSSRCRSPTRRVPIHGRGFALTAVFDSGWRRPSRPLLGHSNVATTTVYANLLDENVRQGPSRCGRRLPLVQVHLHVHVNDELTLDAGIFEEVSGETIVQPPKITLFRQVLDYLRSKPDPPALPSGSMDGNEGAAAAAVVLRWGSYVAVLADKAKPVWAEGNSAEVSRICDSEMARINIEASAALAEWIDLSREDGRLYEKLVGRALAHLPLPTRQAKPQGTQFVMLALPEVRENLARAVPEARLAHVRADVERHPSRVFANALVNTAWRNGPVENIHAGEFRGYPLDRRRVTVAEERTVMGFAIDRLTTGMEVCRGLASETPPRPWSEQVLPYGLAEAMLITPLGWTLTESTREVRLPRGETLA